MSTAVFLILQRYWKPILGVTFALSLVLGVYLKGRSDAKAAYLKASLKATTAAMERYTSTVLHNQAIKDKIADDRAKTPTNDKRDSCLLSNDPFTTPCVD